MTEKQYKTLDSLITGALNNTNLLSGEIKSNSKKLDNLQLNLGLIMENQKMILEELRGLKKTKP